MTIFVSGTSETEAEKAALKRVVEQLSGMLDKTHNTALRLIGWPDSFRPGVNTDPQMEINRQLTEYDIYLGLLGCRFGTPTPRAGSGTEEEFKNALSQFQRNSRTVRVLFYFKKTPLDPFSTDLRQPEKVRNFRTALGTQGIVYRDFGDTAEFVEIVRDNLYHLITDEWTGNSWVEILLAARQMNITGDQDASEVMATPANDTGTSRSDGNIEVSLAGAPITKGVTTEEVQTGNLSTDIEDPDVDDELGFLDFLEEFHAAVNSLTHIFTRISEHTTTIGARFRANAEKVRQLTEDYKRVQHIGGSRVKQDYLSRAKTAVNQAAEDLESYVSDMNGDLLQLRTSNRAMFANLRRALAAQAEFRMPQENPEKDRQALVHLLELMRDNRDRITAFQNSIATMPALTGRFKRARKNATAMLGELVAEVSFSIDEGGKALAELGPNGVEGSPEKDESEEE